jgi:hypothetical protein
MTVRRAVLFAAIVAVATCVATPGASADRQMRRAAEVSHSTGLVVPGKGVIINVNGGQQKVFLGMSRASCCRALVSSSFLWTTATNDPGVYQPGHSSELFIVGAKVLPACPPGSNQSVGALNWDCFNQSVKYSVSVRDLVWVNFDGSDRVSQIVVESPGFCLAKAASICPGSGFASVKRIYGSRAKPYGGNTGGIFCGSPVSKDRPLRLVSGKAKALVATLFFNANYESYHPSSNPALAAISISYSTDRTGKGC